MTHRTTDDSRFASILERQRARREAPTRIFPPDFLHGDFEPQELYETFGADWVERGIFLTFDGEYVAAARFEDYFLHVETAALADIDLPTWLAERLDGRRTVVELAQCGVQLSGRGDEHWIGIRCPRERLAELETEHLSVTRDFDASSAGTLAVRTDVLSLIGLCARLGVERLH